MIMRLRLLGSFLILIVAAATHAQANTVTVTVGGTVTSGGSYYGGGTTTPVLMFAPANVTINVGDTVNFVSHGGAAHNVHALDNSFRCANGCDNDGHGGNGAPSSQLWSSSVTFTTAGTVNYQCDIHSSMGMVGSITVNAVTAPPPKLAIGGYVSGNWYNADQSGSGFQIEATDAMDSASGLPIMLAIWFVYSPDGNSQNWIYAQGTYDPTKNTATLPAQLLSGTKFPPNYVAADVHGMANGWGTLTFAFTDCNNGTVSWNSTAPGYGSGSPMPITRLTRIAGTGCPH
jgi:plastocyanin